jgi:PAS domain-containing protein
MTPPRLSPWAFRLLSGAIAVALIAGAANLSARRAERLLRADLLLQASLIATALCQDRLSALTGTTADYTSPDYLHLHDQLVRIRNASPHSRFIYLMERGSNGNIFFIDDSEPFDSKDHSPPGQTYDEAPEELHAAFAAGQAVVRGPYADRWGTWVSAFVPLSKPDSAMLGLDIDARKWKWIVAARAALPTGLAAIAVLLGLLVVLLQRSRRRLRDRQAELLESENRFVQLAEQGRTIVWEVDPHGLYTHLSPAVEHVLGYRPDELVGKIHFYDLHPEESRADFMRSTLGMFAQHEAFMNSRTLRSARTASISGFSPTASPFSTPMALCAAIAAATSTSLNESNRRPR